eukprot:1425911-Pyramimonas_sp.AAC.1
MTEARHYAATMPNAAPTEVVARAWDAHGPFRRIMMRCARSGQFALQDSFTTSFSMGMLYNLRESQPCRGCGERVSVEWWICPMCHRQWLDETDQPRWPAWRCP